ncbi:hypothetical protein C1646_760944 [Rhizophagus diaphanus]|nr:hypothetical protein C1646_760944 [Rhizophagus diaphanus] [Rhizophagus sp. MUCL 43196]
MSSLEVLEQRIADFKAENLEAECAKVRQEHVEILERIIKLERYFDKLEKESESKKNRKFQTRCIQIAKEILNEEPMIEYRPPFLNGLELDAFFQKYRIALEVQGAQHRLHSTSWYKDVKKLEDIVNHDRQKRCICLDSGIFLIEVWYDQNLIPERIRKIKEFVYLVSKHFDTIVL